MPARKPTGDLQVIQHRGLLSRTIRKLQENQITIGFIGGSITDPRPGYTWPDPVIAWIVENFPNVRVTVENAAIGATGSELAVFRAERDLIDRGCDIVFVEYAVNDGGEPTEKRMRTREGLLRKLLTADCDVVLTYTFGLNMLEEMMRGEMPASIAEFEQLAEHYDLGSVWMGLHALRENIAGRMKWEEWLPDGLHPQFRGSFSYAQSVIEYLEEELQKDAVKRQLITQKAPFPAPLNARNWQRAHVLPFDAVSFDGPWTIRRWTKNSWYGQVISTAAVGARLSFEFEGRALSLGFEFGRISAEFRYRLDGGEWKNSDRDRPAWCGDDGWYRVFSVGDDLPPGRHTIEIEVIHGGADRCNGTNFHLALIGVVP